MNEVPGEELFFVVLLAEQAVLFGVDGHVAKVEAAGRAHEAEKNLDGSVGTHLPH